MPRVVRVVAGRHGRLIHLDLYQENKQVYRFENQRFCEKFSSGPAKEKTDRAQRDRETD
jgi:hypothetical protein